MAVRLRCRKHGRGVVYAAETEEHGLLVEDRRLMELVQNQVDGSEVDRVNFVF